MSVGKLNQLINGSFENYFIRRANEDYLKSKEAYGENITHKSILEYDELVSKWNIEREEKYPIGSKYTQQEKYPNGNKLPTEKWLRDNSDIAPIRFKALGEAWTDYYKVDHNLKEIA